MNTKRILSVFLSSLFVFSMLLDGAGIKGVEAQEAEELDNQLLDGQSLDGQTMMIDDEQVSFTEKDNADGSVELDIDWDNGKKEQLI